MPTSERFVATLWRIKRSSWLKLTLFCSMCMVHEEQQRCNENMSFHLRCCVDPSKFVLYIFIAPLFLKVSRAANTKKNHIEKRRIRGEWLILLEMSSWIVNFTKGWALWLKINSTIISNFCLDYSYWTHHCGRPCAFHIRQCDCASKWLKELMLLLLFNIYGRFHT